MIGPDPGEPIADRLPVDPWAVAATIDQVGFRRCARAAAASLEGLSTPDDLVAGWPCAREAAKDALLALLPPTARPGGRAPLAGHELSARAERPAPAGDDGGGRRSLIAADYLARLTCAHQDLLAVGETEPTRYLVELLARPGRERGVAGSAQAVRMVAELTGPIRTAAVGLHQLTDALQRRGRGQHDARVSRTAVAAARLTGRVAEAGQPELARSLRREIVSRLGSRCGDPLPSAVTVCDLLAVAGVDDGLDLEILLWLSDYVVRRWDGVVATPTGRGNVLETDHERLGTALSIVEVVAERDPGARSWLAAVVSDAVAATGDETAGRRVRQWRAEIDAQLSRQLTARRRQHLRRQQRELRARRQELQALLAGLEVGTHQLSHREGG